jgi:hypothetical protein
VPVDDWTEHRLDRFRDEVWRRLDTMAVDYWPILERLARKRVHDPLAYIARMSDDDLRDLARPLAAPRASTTTTRRPACDTCDQGEWLLDDAGRRIEDSDGRWVKCRHEARQPA